MENFRKRFSNMSLVIREYYKLCINILVATAFLVYMLPYLANGPIYYAAIFNEFVKPC